MSVMVITGGTAERAKLPRCVSPALDITWR